MVEVGRDLKGRETRVRRWMRDRFLQNNFIFIYLSIVVILFLFYFLSVNCLLLIFFCLICVDFFFFAILCCFFCYTLPCFLLVLGDWAYRVICFVVYCYLFILFLYLFLFYFFIFIFIFFTFMDFLGLFFVSLTALGTSSLRLIVFPQWGGGVHESPVLRTDIEG